MSRASPVDEAYQAAEFAVNEQVIRTNVVVDEP